MTSAVHSIVCADLSFAWPDGTPALTDLDLAIGGGTTGLIGLNGSGKSTLLKLIARELTPTGGSVAVAGEVGRLPQTLTLQTDRTVADLLDITATRKALHAIESGDVSAENFAAVGDDWEVEDRARAQLHRFGIVGRDDKTGSTDILDRPVGTLSGGEAVLTGLTKLLLHPPAITLLDEPTNNLDRRARGLLYEAVASWPGVLVVVSHDRELLELVDRIVELRAGAARVFGGNFSEYLAALAVEQQAAERAVRSAEGELKREQRQLIEARIKLDRRVRTGKKAEAEHRVPGIVASARKRSAQESAGKLRIGQEDKVVAAREALTEAEKSVRDDDRIRVDLPGTAVPAGRTLLEVRVRDIEEDGRDNSRTLIVRGPERVALLGRNGSGKTTLLRSIVSNGDGSRSGGPGPLVVVPTRAVGYLPQRLDILDDASSVLDNVRAVNPGASPQQVRAQLARFLIGKRQVDQPAGTLSGGERFRVTLARLLLADPPPQLLLLDEPTNNLDLASVEALADALSGYRGGLVVASHDVPFLRSIGISRWWEFDGPGSLTEVAPL